MLEFPTDFAGSCYEMCGVLLPKYAQRVLEPVLLDMAMGCEVSACWAVVDEIVLCEEALGACIVTGGEMNLSEEESIVGVTFQ